MKKNFMIFGKALMGALALVCGGAGMAVTIADNGSDNDPNNGTPLDDATHDDPNKGIDQQGHAATGSTLEQAELAENKVEDYVTRFQSYKFPMHTDMLTLAKQVKVDTKEPENYVIGEAIMDCVTDASYTSGSTKDASINLYSYIYHNDAKLFCEGCTILVDGVAGYDEQGQADGSPLVLFCTYKQGTTITVEPVNGPLDSGSMYVPTIAASTTLHVMAPAMSESEVEVAPDAAYPQPQVHYLQKKVCAITWTELFERINKKARWNVQDIKDWQLAMFRKKCTRSMLIGAKSKKMKTNSKTGTEYVYTQEGILRQVRLGYQINGDWTIADLVGIAKMLFGKFATSNECDVYVGPDAMEKIANIDFSDHPEIVMQQSLTTFGVGVTSISTPFGKLNFKLEHALEDLGYSSYAVALSMKDAKRFFYQNGKTISIDHSKGEGGEVREAKSQYYIQDDCLAIVGYNSMLIGPNVAAAGFSNVAITVTSVADSTAWAALSPSTSAIYYFLSDITISDVVYTKGLYSYDGTKPVPYEGVIGD